MTLDEGRVFLDECARTSFRIAQTAIQKTVADLTGEGYHIAGSCILMGSGRPLPDLEKILGAHPLIHTAKGEFFRHAIRQGCESCGLSVSGIKERDVAAHAAPVLGIFGEELHRHIRDLGKLIGPPWRQDEKLCAIVAWILLAG